MPILPDEEARLAALEAFNILDTPPDPSLDVITRLAADRFGTEIALVSLVDRERQWFKSRHGLEVCETARSISFCTHSIASDTVMVVPDALLDPRFATGPLVQGPPHIRFYAGAPLITADGHRLGTLCVIDSRPRPGFDGRETAALQLMARLVMDQIESGQLREQQRVYKLIAETSTDAFVCSDAHSRITHWNRAAEAMFGWTAGEALGQTLDLIIPNRHRHGHNSGMERLRLRGPTKLVGKTVEVPATVKAGHEIPIELSLGMWPAEGEGAPEGFAAIIRDGTNRKLMEAQRAATEARLAQQLAAIEASDDGIAITDADGKFMFMNQAHATMFGYPDVESLMGLPWSHLYLPEMADYIGTVAMPVLGQTGRWRGEVTGRKADGTPVEQEVSLSLSPEGGIVCVTRDIGGRLAMEREKVRLREQLMLAQRQEAVGQLASGIAHDFNNLIAAIAGTAGLLEATANPDVRFHASRIQSAAGTAAALVEKLLGLGRRTPDLQPVDLCQLLGNVRDLLAPSLVDPRHRIDVELPDAALLAEADPTELMQVVLNLAINARDALPAGGDGRIGLLLRDAAGLAPHGQVMVGQVPAGPAAVIRVTDNGCGIPADALRQVFEPFYTRKGKAGTGLGLAVVAGIVAAAGGAIALHSTPGEGSCFELWWPLDAPAAPGQQAAASRDVPGDVLAGKAVLVVDDNEAVVDTLVAMLEQAGAEPGPCLDAGDALLAVEEDPGAWDLVITDYDMPGMNGAELATRLRAIRPDLPVLLMSALPRARTGPARPGDLFDAVLAKPASMALLLDAARSAMAVARQRTK